MPAAAIDVGTNTVRLLVAEVEGVDITQVARALEITRLGRGVDATGTFDPDALKRTLAVVYSFTERARALGADPIRITGTSAVRDAGDRESLSDAVRRQTGVALEVLSGDAEGRLTFLGATTGLHDGPYVVIDIGGGSTELITTVAVRSMDVGSVRVRERFLRSDPPSPGEVALASAFVSTCLAEIEDGLQLTGDETLVGVAGTVTTLAALVGGLEQYDPDRVHGLRLKAADVESWTDRLCKMTVDEIRRLPTMEPGRADVICAGVLILREVCRHFGYAEVRVSERDILDGLVLDAVRP